MKQSDFFEKLNRELENAVPPMSERLKDEPICTHKDEPVRTQAEADAAERAKKAPVSAGTTRNFFRINLSRRHIWRFF